MKKWHQKAPRIGLLLVPVLVIAGLYGSTKEEHQAEVAFKGVVIIQEQLAGKKENPIGETPIQEKEFLSEEKPNLEEIEVEKEKKNSPNLAAPLREVTRVEGPKEIPREINGPSPVPIEKPREVAPKAPNIPKESQIAPQVDGELNKYVLDIIKTYKGSYPYILNNDYNNYNGVSENIIYQDRLLLKAHPSGNRATHCVGITFEVFFKGMQERNRVLGLPIDNINNMTADDMWDFILMWFVASGPKAQNNCAVAIEKYGLGKRITNLHEVKAGDFIDFSRENNTGHTAVFLDWIKEDGKIVGLKYWSSQGSTKGIAYNEEYFNVKDSQGKKYGNVIIDEIYIGRVVF